MKKKQVKKIDSFQYGGFFTSKDVTEESIRLVTGREGMCCLYWLVKESNGIIFDARFQAFGPIALILAAEIACELVIGKNYDQASRISIELLSRHMEEIAIGFNEKLLLTQVITAIDKAVYQCIDIPFAAAQYVSTPIESALGSGTNPIVDWNQLSQDARLHILEEVIAKEVRPYVELDAGGVRVVEIKDLYEVMIAYDGACTTCHASTGSTLLAIEQILKTRVHPDLFITSMSSPENKVTI